MPKKKQHEYPESLVKLMTTLQTALYDNKDDEWEEFDEPYYKWLSKRFYVTRQKFMGGSFLLNGFNVYAPLDDENEDVLWRAVWAPFYPEDFLIQLVTGVETRDVWQWTKLRKVPRKFYTFETVRRYDKFEDWLPIEEAIKEALDSYHEWKTKKLTVAV